MGFPVKIFCQAPDEEWICAICHDVFESPVCCPCGHSYCRLCLEAWLEPPCPRENCPTCRCHGLYLDKDSPTCQPCGNLERMIAKAKVSCSQSSITISEPPSARRRLNNGEVALSGCDWAGTLGDWKVHCDKECPEHVIKCSVAECSHECQRKNMPDHMAKAMTVHLEHLVGAETLAIKQDYNRRLDKIEHKFQTKLLQLEKKQENRMAQMNVNNFLTQWIRRKPAALFDFCVYSCNPTDNGLLVGIPGPKNTPWEGGLFPLRMSWCGCDRPPKCNFPDGFHHINVFSNGYVALSTLREEQGWEPIISIPEILFSIQALLAHPNPDSPAQAEASRCHQKSKDDYNEKARKLAKTYCASGDFIAMARAAFGEEMIPISMSTRLVDDKHSLHKLAPVSLQAAPSLKAFQLQSPTPPELPADASCRCSCCAWGTTFWDETKEMRHIFGC